ncbi:MAG: hypothetical protein RR444_12335 [Oscillospiraceae bacterium]
MKKAIIILSTVVIAVIIAIIIIFSSIGQLQAAVALLSPETSQSSDTSLQNSEVPQEEKVEDMVYWVPNGKVWHTSPYCRTLSNSENIYESSIEDSGKSRCCKVCGE